MNTNLEFKILSLLSSRSFHDLSGPISAICNGLSFLDDPDIYATAKEHLENSALHLNTRLEFLRLMMSERKTSEVGWTKIQKISEQYFTIFNDINLQWNTNNFTDVWNNNLQFIKTFYCLIMSCIEALKGKGTITINEISDNTLSVSIINAHINMYSTSLAILNAQKDVMENLSARTAPMAWVTTYCKTHQYPIVINSELSISEENKKSQITIQINY